MIQEKVEQLLQRQKEKYKEIYDRFEIGQTVEFTPDDGDYYEVDEYGHIEGKVVDKSYSQYTCELRVDIDGSGTELWIDAEDAF